MNHNRYEPLLPTSSNSEDAINSLDSRRHSIECVNFVREALQVAQADAALSPKRIANAKGLCRVLLEISVDRFGANGKQILLDWGIERSEDVGSIVYRLIDAELVNKSKRDSLDDFNGLFDLTISPVEWELQW